MKNVITNILLAIGVVLIIKNKVILYFSVGVYGLIVLG